jgi:hypothetical protein
MYYMCIIGKNFLKRKDEKSMHKNRKIYKRNEVFLI